MHKDLEKFYFHEAEVIQYRGIDRLIRENIHKNIEKQISKDFKAKKVLELGALFGNHKNFISHNFDEYYETDLLIKKDSIENLKNYNLIRMPIDAEDLSKFKSNYFDRLIATCLIVHLNFPEKALKEWKRVVKKDGYLTIWVQLEPSLLLRMYQYLVSKRKNKNFDEIHYLEHLHYYQRIDYLIQKEFEHNSIKKIYYPFRFLSWNLNTTAIYTIKI